MEEHTVDHKPKGEVHSLRTEQLDEKDAYHAVETGEDLEKSEISGVEITSDKAENEVLKGKEGMMHTDEETENEFQEEDENLDEMEEVHGKHEPMVPVEMEFVKKKKAEPKVRLVDMDIYYPDESKSSMEENIVEKKVVEVEAEGLDQDIEDSEELIDPNKDYSVVDPSFLDEFLSSEEEHSTEAKKIEAKKRAEAFELVEEEEEDFQQEIYVQPPDREPSDRVYDKICDLETPASSDESFKVPRFRYIPRRKSYPSQGFKMEENKWLTQTQSLQSMEVPSTALLNLMENVAPALKKTLLEIATYHPSNAAYYMTHSLLHKSKTPEEMGLEPDPHLIQLIVDGQNKKKKKTQKVPILRKSDEIFIAPYAESHISTPLQEIKAGIPFRDDDDDDDDDEDASQLQKFQRKYRKAKKEILAEEKANRSNLDRKTFLPGPCLGPTSLPLMDDISNLTNVKFGSPKA